MRNLIKSLFFTSNTAAPELQPVAPKPNPFLAMGEIVVHQHLDRLYEELTHVMSRLLKDNSSQALRQQKTELQTRIEHVNKTWKTFESNVRRCPYSADLSSTFAEFKSELEQAENFIWLAPQAA